MRLPGFDAEAAIYRCARNYATLSGPTWGSSGTGSQVYWPTEVTPSLSSNQSGAVVPALPLGNGGLGGGGGGGVGANCPTIGPPCDSKCHCTLHPCHGSPRLEFICGAGFKCEGGKCVCPAPNTACGVNLCTNTQTDPNNCGACGNSCNGGTCVGGKCSCPAASGLALCSGNTCTNLQTDANNCGSCGNKCNPGVGCVEGLCQCPQGQGWTDEQNSCVGAVREYSATLHGPPGTSASIDMCYCTLGPPPMNNETPYLCTQKHFLFIADRVKGYWKFLDPTCCTSQGLSLCGSSCVNLSSDPQNCGTCEGQCSATQICQNGMCVDCPAGTSDCGNTNTCCSSAGCCQLAQGLVCCDPMICATTPDNIATCCIQVIDGVCCDGVDCGSCQSSSSNPACGACCPR
jgi:hypothetical protein